MCMAGHHAVGVAAGKFRTAIITSCGDIYAWDGEKMKTDTPVPFRIQGIKHASYVSVGENHSLAVASVFTPKFPPQCAATQLYSPVDSSLKDLEDSDEALDFDGTMSFDHFEGDNISADLRRLPLEPPSLKELCENVVCQQVVEPKNSLQLLEVADSLGASKLRKHCEVRYFTNANKCVLLQFIKIHFICGLFGTGTCVTQFGLFTCNLSHDIYTCESNITSRCREGFRCNIFPVMEPQTPSNSYSIVSSSCGK